MGVEKQLRDALQQMRMLDDRLKGSNTERYRRCIEGAAKSLQVYQEYVTAVPHNPTCQDLDNLESIVTALNSLISTAKVPK